MICSECGEDFERLIKGMCRKCYRREYYLDNKARYICVECEEPTKVLYNKLCPACYSSTISGYIHIMFINMSTRAKIFKRDLEVDRKWLTEFLTTNNKFTNIFVDWLNTGRKKKNAPSIDRIDNNKGYVKDNIQVMSVSGNSRKYQNSIDNNNRVFIKNETHGRIEYFRSIKEAAENFNRSPQWVRNRLYNKLKKPDTKHIFTVITKEEYECGTNRNSGATRAVSGCNTI